MPQNSPANFRGLMGLYEQNYQRLLRLLPEWPLPFEEAISTSSSDRRLHLRVLESTKYTDTVHLTYLFHDEEMLAEPDMDVRLFHDAGLAEVLGCAMLPRKLNFGNFNFESTSALEARWGRNLFLNKWLDYLLEHGHGFVSSHRPRVEQAY